VGERAFRLAGSDSLCSVEQHGVAAAGDTAKHFQGGLVVWTTSGLQGHRSEITVNSNKQQTAPQRAKLLLLLPPLLSS
jgi:hypothetical protein